MKQQLEEICPISFVFNFLCIDHLTNLKTFFKLSQITLNDATSYERSWFKGITSQFQLQLIIAEQIHLMGNSSFLH